MFVWRLSYAIRTIGIQIINYAIVYLNSTEWITNVTCTISVIYLRQDRTIKLLLLAPIISDVI